MRAENQRSSNECSFLFLAVQKLWLDAQSEQVRLKILGVVDRLLDRTIMRDGDGNFGAMLKWLVLVEESLDPYRSAEVLKLVLNLIKRAEDIKMQPLTPLTETQFSVTFDSWDQFKRYKSHYCE
jgi:hypothetical protein